MHVTLIPMCYLLKLLALTFLYDVYIYIQIYIYTNIYIYIIYIMYICKLKKYVHQVSNHGVFRRWFTETDVKHFKNGA